MTGLRHYGIVLSLALGSVPLYAKQSDSSRTDSLTRVVLEPLRVTVTRSDAALFETPYAISAVGQAEIRRGRATDGLEEALGIIPGVLVSHRYNYSLDRRITIRGFGARSAFGVRGMRILLDGIPQTLPDGQGQLTSIELGDIDHIEVMRGLSSSLYGNASGGVISVQTNRDRPAVVAPHVRVTAGAFGFRKWQVGASAPAGAGQAHVTISRTTLDGFRDHSRADIRHVNVRLAEPLTPRTDLTLLVHLADSPLLQNPGALTAGELDTLPEQAAPRNVTADARKNVTQAQAGLALRHQYGAGGMLDVAVFGTRRDLDNPLSFATIDLARWAYGVRATTTLPPLNLGIPQLFTLGVDLQWQRDDRLNTTPDGTATTLDQLERVTEFGPFAQTVAPLGERVTLTAGVRYDRVSFRVEDQLTSDGDQSGERVMDAVSGSGGITVRLGEALWPYANVGTGFETPTTTEIVNRPEGGGGLNPEIDPQHATSIEAGARGQIQQVVEYAVSAFHVWVRDALIPFEVPTEPGRQFYRNVGSSRHRGAEVAVRARLPAGVTAIAAFTLSDFELEEFQTEDGTFDGNTIPGVPTRRLYWSLRYDAPLGFWGAVDNTHTSSMYVDDANSAEASGWTTVGLRAGWDGMVAGRRVAPFVSVLNLLDEQYVSSVVVNARRGRYFEPAAGRNVIVGLAVY